MPKFKDGDIVYCTLKRGDWDDSATVSLCGDGEEDMRTAVEGFPMAVEAVGTNTRFQSYYLSSETFEQEWWFHEDDLELFNLSLENK